MILLDTSGVLAAVDSQQVGHPAAAAALRVRQVRLLSPFVLAELDYMMSTRVSHAAAGSLLDEVAHGVYELAMFTNHDVEAASTIMRRYADLNIGLTDASIMVLAERVNCHDVLTFDQRHFRAVRSWIGLPFRLLPLDPK